MGSTAPLLRVTDCGLYCERGGFYVDPWKPVPLALITHAHSDHARWGSQKYICSERGLKLTKHRLHSEQQNVSLSAMPWHQQEKFGDVKVSFHPAGHILGSAQIRVECDGEVWVVSGDYKRNPDPSCDPFEVVPCDVFISEATFALPIYRWQSGEEIASEIFDWWQLNAKEGRPSLLLCYALGKAQRVLAELTKFTDKAVFVHGAVESLTSIYRDEGIKLLPTLSPAEAPRKYDFSGDLILAPPSAYRSTWMKRFKGVDTAFASGWMRVRGNRRRKGFDKGFVLSDHADFFDLVRTSKETGAKKVLATHGYSETLVRYLKEQGIDAEPLATAYGDEEGGD
jgi:putative mRNA 3-end processing factor